MIATPLSSFSTPWKNRSGLLFSAESRSSAGIADASPRDETDESIAGVAAVTRASSTGVADRPCSSAAWVSLALLALVRPTEEARSNLVEVPLARRNAMSSRVRFDADYVFSGYGLQRNGRKALEVEVGEGRLLKSSRVGGGRHP